MTASLAAAHRAVAGVDNGALLSNFCIAAHRPTIIPAADLRERLREFVSTLNESFDHDPLDGGHGRGGRGHTRRTERAAANVNGYRRVGRGEAILRC